MTLFGRGRTGAEPFPERIRLIGDRDSGNYRALQDGTRDGLVDVSGSPARARAAGLPATAPEVTAADVLVWDPRAR